MRAIAFFIGLALLVACGDAAAPNFQTVDAGVVVEADASAPVHLDAAIQVPDAGPGRDAGVAPALDAGSPTPRDSGVVERDSGSPSMDAGAPLVDSGEPPADAGAPFVDSGLTGCTGHQRVMLPRRSSSGWTVTRASTSNRSIAARVPLSDGTYRLGIVVEADDPRARIVIVASGCAPTVQVCADQYDADRSVDYPNAGHDSCQVEGWGSASMGVSCSFDAAPAEVEIFVTQAPPPFGSIPDDDPASCSPGFTARAFEVSDPTRPSDF